MRVQFTREAQEDRHRIWLFQSDWSVPYADEVQARLIKQVSLLASFPNLGRPVGKGLRRFSVRDVQLVAEYRVDEDAVHILRVWHTRQNRTDS